jgi:hypothetical protein
MDLLTRPTSTISTMSMVSLSVTRRPEGLKLGSMLSLVSHLLISGPPPCTSTGRRPRHHSSTKSFTTRACAVSTRAPQLRGGQIRTKRSATNLIS